MKPSSLSRPDPVLPTDLERIIFEIAALSEPTTIPKLMLIAWRVKDWLEPLLYRTVFLENPMSTLLLHAQNVGLPVLHEDHLLGIIKTNPTFFQHAVKHLFIGLSVERSTVESVLTACTHITNLFAQFTPSDHMRSLSALRDVRYLTIDIQAIVETVEIDILHSLFREVTHLELLLFTNVSPDRLCDRLSLIPNLTHLALNSPLHVTVSHAALQANAQLQCIIFLITAAVMEGSPLLGDHRFLCMDQNLDYRLDWLCGARAGADYWELADEFLAARRAKKIDAFTYGFADDDHSWRV
ncbi:hypothetical protein B0H19DRAFT_1140186 [Mycena capillaripes]|nr:hypothetical protein B0H19DRAFT_1140186 [Mycena capillaripes]